MRQLQAELAARESAESRLKSEPEAEASRPKLSFGFKPMKDEPITLIY